MAFSRWSIVVLEESYLCVVPSFYYCNKYLCKIGEQEYKFWQSLVVVVCDKSLEMSLKEYPLTSTTQQSIAENESNRIFVATTDTLLFKLILIAATDPSVGNSWRNPDENAEVRKFSCTYARRISYQCKFSWVAYKQVKTESWKLKRKSWKLEMTAKGISNGTRSTRTAVGSDPLLKW